MLFKELAGERGQAGLSGREILYQPYSLWLRRRLNSRVRAEVTMGSKCKAVLPDMVFLPPARPRVYVGSDSSR
jgi:hypothetical protein